MDQLDTEAMAESQNGYTMAYDNKSQKYIETEARFPR